MRTGSWIAVSIGVLPWASAQVAGIEPSMLRARNVKVESVVYKGRKAVRLADAIAPSAPDGARLALVAASDFQDGVIEADLTGDTLPTAAPDARGFTGIAFRSAADGSRYEAFYLRPKNGRALDQLQRNHSTQYISEPEYPWQRLRQDTPGKYESYVDLAPGEWTHVRIEVRGAAARLYVNSAPQPALIVSDLKHGQSKGAIALWIGPGTVAHFSDLKITRQ